METLPLSIIPNGLALLALCSSPRPPLSTPMLVVCLISPSSTPTSKYVHGDGCVPVFFNGSSNLVCLNMVRYRSRIPFTRRDHSSTFNSGLLVHPRIPGFSKPITRVRTSSQSVHRPSQPAGSAPLLDHLLSRRSRSTSGGSRGQPKSPWTRLGSMVSWSTVQMGTWLTSSCKMYRIRGRTSTEDRSRTGRGSRWRSWKRSRNPLVKIGLLFVSVLGAPCTVNISLESRLSVYWEAHGPDRNEDGRSQTDIHLPRSEDKGTLP